jgi:hypothetical protein
MGNWRITISGHGGHHNGRPDDAEALARGLVEDMQATGHQITKAEFVLTDASVSGTPTGTPESLLQAASQGGYIGSSGETDPAGGNGGG